MKRVKEDNFKVGDDTCKESLKKMVNICPEDLGKVLTSEGALSRPFSVGDFVSVNRSNLLVKGYFDFYGGYANHAREVVFRLGETGKFNVKVDPIKSPIDIHPSTVNKLNWYVHNPAFKKENSKTLVIAGPGHLREGFCPEVSDYRVGWTMIETLDVMPDIVDWCNNVDLILCPTSIDYRRFSVAKGLKTELANCRIGYDQKVFNPEVKPMDIVNLRNRYVFGVVGSWNYRKSVRETVEAYCMAFDNTDPVSLLLVCKYGNRPFGEHKDNKEMWGIKPELSKILKSINKDPDKIPHICVLDVPMHPEVIPHLYARIDCLVGFSKGESTWLPGLELAGMKKPVIQLHNEACGYMDYMRGARYLCRDVKYKECGPELYEGTSEYYYGEKMGFGNAFELEDMLVKVYRESGSAIQQSEINERYNLVKDWTWDNSIKSLIDILL